jgi:hypothetical protein
MTARRCRQSETTVNVSEGQKSQQYGVLFLLKIFLFTVRVDYEGKNVTLKTGYSGHVHAQQGILRKSLKRRTVIIFRKLVKGRKTYASARAYASEAKTKKCVRRRH